MIEILLGALRPFIYQTNYKRYSEPYPHYNQYYLERYVFIPGLTITFGSFKCYSTYSTELRPARGLLPTGRALNLYLRRHLTFKTLATHSTELGAARGVVPTRRTFHIALFWVSIKFCLIILSSFPQRVIISTSTSSMLRYDQPIYYLIEITVSAVFRV